MCFNDQVDGDLVAAVPAQRANRTGGRAQAGTRGGGQQQSGTRLRRLPPRPIISREAMTINTLDEACRRTGEALNGLDYALIGGAACILMGAPRTTKDLDIVVPDNQKRRTASRLAEHPNFGMSRHGNETWFTSSHNTNHNFDILAAKDIQQAFDRGTPTRVMRGIRVLPPALILNTKCAAWSTDDPMRTMEKKNDDRLDIQFLINYMASRGERTSREEVPNATEDFLDAFVALNPETRNGWRSIGLTSRSV